MPVNEKSYGNGKIYRIWSLDTDKIYIGSTCDTLSNRFCNHKSGYKYWKNGKDKYISSFALFELVGVDNCKIELEHNFACESKTKLNKEEGRIQRLYKDIIVNKNESGRTMKEYHQEHKEEIQQYMKEYNKEYKQEHKQEIKEYYQKHKEEINQKKYVKHDCECGGKYVHSTKSRHFRTTKHLNYINNIQGFQTLIQHKINNNISF